MLNDSVYHMENYGEAFLSHTQPQASRPQTLSFFRAFARKQEKHWFRNQSYHRCSICLKELKYVLHQPKIVHQICFIPSFPCIWKKKKTIKKTPSVADGRIKLSGSKESSATASKQLRPSKDLGRKQDPPPEAAGREREPWRRSKLELTRKPYFFDSGNWPI